MFFDIKFWFIGEKETDEALTVQIDIKHLIYALLMHKKERQMPFFLV